MRICKLVVLRVSGQIFHILLIGFLISGCAEKNIDRSRVNDPMMSLDAPRATSQLSPLTGLNARNRASGGTACSVCAQ